MDATRARRTRDQARQAWYAQQRQRRFARFVTSLATTSAPVATALGLQAPAAPRPGPAEATGSRVCGAQLWGVHRTNESRGTQP
jgi:hypothetical protein